MSDASSKVALEAVGSNFVLLRIIDLIRSGDMCTLFPLHMLTINIIRSPTFLYSGCTSYPNDTTAPQPMTLHLN
eukprot:scaffold9183_cov117-Skeletonema_dohrnii-CCMP3373.AAC.6